MKLDSNQTCIYESRVMRGVDSPSQYQLFMLGNSSNSFLTNKFSRPPNVKDVYRTLFCAHTDSRNINPSINSTHHTLPVTKITNQKKSTREFTPNNNIKKLFDSSYESFKFFLIKFNDWLVIFLSPTILLTNTHCNSKQFLCLFLSYIHGVATGGYIHERSLILLTFVVCFFILRLFCSSIENFLMVFGKFDLLYLIFWSFFSESSSSILFFSLFIPTVIT